jgi:DNA repair protein RecO (recombination protein O)
MRWSDDAIVLSARRLGESGLLVHLLTETHGRHAGLVRGGQKPRGRAIYQIGNRLAVTWSARLEEHLGTIQGELVHAFAAALIDAPARLGGLAAAAALADAALPEREPHAPVFARLLALYDALEADRGWMPLYAEWELALLTELGFGLDLARCAVTGGTADLVYVSPNSGRAVSAAGGEAYRERLLRLPAFLRAGANAPPGLADILDALTLTGFFLDRRIFVPHDRNLPPARTRFLDMLRQFATISSS